MGQYRGPANRNYNLMYKIPSYIPIIFHNLSRYNAHLFIRELGKKFNKSRIGIISENKKKYVSFIDNVIGDAYKNTCSKIKEKKIQLRFFESVRFMASSLDSLTSNLVGTNEIFCTKCDCKERFELIHISENYVAYGKCGSYSEYVSK